MKLNHQFAMEYIARLLRRTVNHNGPVKRHQIDPWLRKDAVMAFRDLLPQSSIDSHRMAIVFPTSRRLQCRMASWLLRHEVRARHAGVGEIEIGGFGL
jgi:hypothetical protein